VEVPVIEYEKVFAQLIALDFTPFALAILLGGAIGLEREFHGRPAGLRTHIMVCLSSALLVQASRWAPDLTDHETVRMVLDPNRLASGIVTGIGFLGAAAVIRSGDIVRGITTGACVWAVAGIGVIIGQGQYGLAVAGGLTMLLVLVAFDSIFGWVKPVIYRRLLVRGASAGLEEVNEQVRSLLAARHVRVQDITLSKNPATYELVFHVRCRQHISAPALLEELSRALPTEQTEWTRIS